MTSARLLLAKTTTASFDVDAQYSFTPECPNELPASGATEIVAELNAQAQFAAYRLGSKDAHSPQAIWVATKEFPILSPVVGDNVDVRWPIHAVPGTKGFELIAGLPAVVDYDFFVWKGVELDLHPYGACFHDIAEQMSTGVIEFLRQKCVDTVIVGGLVTDYCVKTTTLQLRRAGFRVIVNLGACRGAAAQSTRVAIADMRANGVDFVNSAVQLENY